MIYLRDASSEALAAHMRSLKKMAVWHDPLADRLWREVEELKAENEDLKTGLKAYEQVNTGLREEIEALRKDAERYRWLREKSTEDDGYTHGLCIDIWDSGSGVEVTFDAADSAIDEAMSKA